VSIRERIVKVLLPPGSTTQTEQQIAAQVPASGVNVEPLERNPADYITPFAPGRPLIPALINPPREDGRTAPRRYEFPVAWNLQITAQRVVPFQLLREVADGSDIVRKSIEIVKAGIAGMEWDISLSPDATERIMGESGGTGHSAAAKEAREALLPEITRCKDFWYMPDRINGLTFPEWVSMAVEEMLVIDGLTIYPNKTLDEANLHSLEILDGATIKPLLDDRGGRPIPPYPAYQQILWGFPRGEFTASADADGEFTVDDLIYAPRTRRPFTPYGYSAVERALPVVDLYMKRLQWLRTEFTDGVTPDMIIKTDATYGSNPEILRAYERIFNDDLGGKTEARRRMRILPEGMDPMFSPSLDSKYKPEFDEYLIKQICSHFGVLPTQIGFAPRQGLGGSGVQDGEASSAETLGMRPIVLWVTDLLNQMSYRFLGMPKDLAFTLSYRTSDDGQIDATRRQTQLATGQITINEARAELGLPLFSFPEADMPMIPSTTVPVSSVEARAEDAVVGLPGHSKPEVEGEAGNGDLTEPEKNIELEAFKRWSKTGRKRAFNFEHLDSDTAVKLNALAQVDPVAARELANVFKASDSYSPPDGVRAAAKRALGWLKEGHAGSGFTDVGRKRASDLARGAAVSRDTVGRMANFFARHAKDSQAVGFSSGEEGFPSPGRVAWDAWGGDAGRTWAQAIVDRDEKSIKAGGARGRVLAPSRGIQGPATDRVVFEEVSRFAWTR
jgi:hypothetical protein